MKNLFALSLVSVLLILGCGKSGSDFKLQKGTPAYELASQLSEIISLYQPISLNSRPVRLFIICRKIWEIDPVN
jgi:hypothetical protein